MDSKKWYLSKVLWVNSLAIIGDIILHITNNPLPEGWDIAILGVINMVLRLITRQPVTW